MSFLTDFIGGAFEVGQIRFDVENGQSITGADGRFYLRSGIVTSAIGSYPQAASLEKCKVTGIPTTLTNAANFTQIADNGAGTIIACHNDGTNADSIYRSTNGGTSWTAVSAGWGGSVRASAVVWTGTRFMIAGCDTNAIYSANSTTGSSWSTHTVGTTAGNLLTGTVRGVWDGTRIYFAASSSGGAAAGSVINLNDSASPTTTSRTAPSSNTMPFNCFADGSTIVLCASGEIRTTTDGGATHTSKTPFSGFTGELHKIGSVYVGVADYGIYTSSDLNTWTLVNSPSTVLKCGRVSKSGSYLYISLYASDGCKAIAWTSDGVNFYFRQLSALAGNANNDWIMAVSGTILFPSSRASNADTGGSILKVASWTTPDYVGCSREVYQDATNKGTTSTVGYMGLA